MVKATLQNLVIIKRIQLRMLTQRLFPHIIRNPLALMQHMPRHYLRFLA